MASMVSVAIIVKSLPGETFAIHLTESSIVTRRIG